MRAGKSVPIWGSDERVEREVRRMAWGGRPGGEGKLLFKRAVLIVAETE